MVAEIQIYPQQCTHMQICELRKKVNGKESRGITYWEERAVENFLRGMFPPPPHYFSHGIDQNVRHDKAPPSCGCWGLQFSEKDFEERSLWPKLQGCGLEWPNSTSLGCNQRWVGSAWVESIFWSPPFVKWPVCVGVVERTFLESQMEHFNPGTTTYWL